MADKKVDVGVRLKMEQTDAAASEVDKLRKRVLELEGSTKKSESSFADLAKQAAAMTLAVNVMPAIHQVLDFGKSLVEAAMHAGATDRAIAGLITSVQGLPLAQAREQATGYRHDLEEIGVAAGVAEGDVEGAFQAMVEMRGATTEGLEASRASVEQLAVVSRTLGKSVEGISREYGFMSEGVLRTRGQLFQLLQTTGIFGNNTKKAAEYWSKLTEEDRIKALDTGLARIAGSMAKAEPSAGALLQSIENLYETAKERLGESLLKELVPVLQEVKMRMMAAIPAIEKFAHEIGPEVGKWVGAAVTKVEEGFKYLKDHSKEIHDTIVSAFETAKSVVDFIIANKDAIAIAFGAKMAIPVALGAAKGVGSAYGAFKGFGALAESAGAGAAGAVTIASMASFAAAVAVFAAAAYFLGKHIQESKEHVETQTATLGAIQKVAETGDVQRVEKLSATFKQLAMTTDGELNPSLEAALNHIHSIAETSQRMKDADLSSIQKEIDTAIAKMKELPEVTTAIAGVQGQKVAQDYSNNMVQNQVSLLIDAYNEATRVGSSAMQGMALQTIAGSKVLEDAFLKSSMAVEGGLDKFADIVLAGGSQFAGFAAAIRGKGGAAKVPAAPAVHMSGGQTFKITQDFREADPDRIALIFERDMVKLAENRIQARTTIPFGG